MSVTAPPRSPRPNDPVDRAELEALVEALIEEARRRARRRRWRNGGGILLALLAGGGLYFGLHHGGGTTSGTTPAAAAPAGAATATAHAGGGQWNVPQGPEGGRATTVAVAPSAPDTVYVGTGRGVFRSTNGGRSWTGAGLVPATTADGSGPGSHIARDRPAVGGHRVRRSQRPMGRWDVERRDDLSAGGLQDHERREDLARTRLDRPACSDQSDRAADRLRDSQWARRNGPSPSQRGRRSQLAAGGQWPSFDPCLGARVRPGDAGTVYAAMAQRGIFESSDGGVGGARCASLRHTGK